MGHIITVFTDGFLEFLVKLLSLSTAFDKFWIVKEVVMSHTKLCHFIQAIRALLRTPQACQTKLEARRVPPNFGNFLLRNVW